MGKSDRVMDSMTSARARRSPSSARWNRARASTIARLGRVVLLIGGLLSDLGDADGDDRGGGGLGRQGVPEEGVALAGDVQGTGRRDVDRVPDVRHGAGDLEVEGALEADGRGAAVLAGEGDTHEGTDLDRGPGLGAGRDGEGEAVRVPERLVRGHGSGLLHGAAADAGEFGVEL